MMNSLYMSLKGLFELLPEFSNHNYDVTDYLLTMASWSSVTGVIVAILILFALLLLNRTRWNISGRFLTTSFVIVWLAGFVIYDVGMYIGHERSSLFANIPMAIVHAFEMFLLDSDVAAIHDQFHDNWCFMLAFSVVHLLAAFITLFFVIKHFGYNIIAGFRMLFEAHFMNNKRDTYVFWGLNDATYLLARSIREHYGSGNKNYRIIVVRTNHDGETTSVKNGMERLFNFLSLRNNDLERLRELDCFTTSTYTDLIHLALDDFDESGYSDVLRHHLDLNMLSRIISRKTSGDVHLFFLTDNDNENIQAVGNLKRDETITSFARGGKKAIFYCKARYNSVHRVIEDEQNVDSIIVKVVDPSHISVEMLKQDVRLQPVSFVDIEPDATVSSSFDALVVGFGEVGYDTVRFLYEFGAFVKTGSDDKDVERSDFHCDVVDKDIKNLAGLFSVNAPSISPKMSYNDEQGDHKMRITLHDLDIHSVDFYNHIEHLIETLNYVVIALDDDEQNVSLAVRIFRLALRHPKDMNHFRILARVRNDKGGHLLRIAEHYNRLWAAQVHSDDSTKYRHQLKVRSDDKIHEPITLFGSMASTYTWDYIVSDRLKEEAMSFKDKYDQSLIAAKIEKETPLKWDEEHRDLMQLSGDYIGYSPTYTGIMRLRRVQRQNMENCFHELTKRMLAKVALGPHRYALITQHLLSRGENEIEYKWQNHAPDPAVTRVLDVLAQTEHLRWMASHEILGYRDGGDEGFQDETRLLHGCLKPWNELSIPVKSYDYNIVDVSLDII